MTTWPDDEAVERAASAVRLFLPSIHDDALKTLLRAALMAAGRPDGAEIERLRADLAEAKDLLCRARGWAVTCSSSATARRDLKAIDALLTRLGDQP